MMGNPTRQQMYALQIVHDDPGRDWPNRIPLATLTDCNCKGWIQKRNGGWFITESGKKIWQARK